MTGTCARTHGDRVFNEFLEMPDVPTLAQAFRDDGYQAYGVGKLHVYPQRARIGFDDVRLNEEGRRVNYPYEMREDDYARFINRKGYTGLDYAHGMSTNNYVTRPWHLPEHVHQTSWTTREMCEQIIRRDPTRPSFWYCGYTAPHPPLVPVQEFLDMYADIDVELPRIAPWASDPNRLPYCVQYYRSLFDIRTEKLTRSALKAFYALCTHIDFSIRSIIGTLREERLLDDTIIALTCDHGDMLGTNGLWAKNLFYEESARVPFIVIPTPDDHSLRLGEADDRLVELRDMMPTLLSMAGAPVPESVEGLDLSDPSATRDHVYGELWEDDRATRMIRTDQYKLIYYAVGNKVQLFDMHEDPLEMNDLSGDRELSTIRRELEEMLIGHLYGSDRHWVKEGDLVGLPDKAFTFRGKPENCGVLANRDLLLQRGIR